LRKSCVEEEGVGSKALRRKIKPDIQMLHPEEYIEKKVVKP